jgi:hypothetical protein
MEVRVAVTNRICSVEGCGKQHEAWGFCRTHYRNAKGNGDPLAQERKRARAGEPLAWLQAHKTFDRDEDCLTWPFARMRGGYGHLQIDGKFYPAHRHMCVLAHGEPPSATAQAAHSCGNGKNGCVNPKHLRWLSPSENALENVVLGSTRTGAAHPMTFFSEREVRAIRRLSDHGVVQRRLAEAFGVSPQRINEIVKRKSWKHLA